MMPGVGFEEMILLVLVAIIVIGPKDLPLMMRKFGRFTGKMRAMAFEFKQGFDELGRQAELEELRKEVADLKKHTGLEDLRKDLEDDTRNLESDVRSALTDTAPRPVAAAPGEPAPGAEPPPALPPASSADKWPKPVKRTPMHPAAASAVTMARPDAAPEPAPYAGLSADHPGYDTGEHGVGEDFRLEGHAPETFAPVNGAHGNGAHGNGAHVNGAHANDHDDGVHVIPDDEVRTPAAPPPPQPVKQETPA